jgi:hypothetical protein
VGLCVCVCVCACVCVRACVCVCMLCNFWLFLCILRITVEDKDKANSLQHNVHK